MKRTGILACATLAFCLLASPLAAQEAAPPVPQAEQLPPPPPFPPMPSSKPSHRWVDVGGPSRARSKASPARHHASAVKRDGKAHASSKSRTSHKARTSHEARASQKARASKATASHRSVRKAKPMHFSAKTIRSCHAMTYRQIMRNSSCRAMIKQELAAPATPKHRTSHKASAHHKAGSRSKTARSHSTVKRRRR